MYQNLAPRYGRAPCFWVYFFGTTFRTGRFVRVRKRTQFSALFSRKPLRSQVSFNTGTVGLVSFNTQELHK